MGFKKYEIYVLESLFYGNATYIFGTRWEELSKKTKAEILGDELQEHRLVHNSGWKSKIDKVLENEFNKQKVENLSQRRNSKNKR